jgi:general secretion pathway protein B
MSFILDALRKSDAERQRSATTGLSDIRYGRRSGRRSLWLPLLAVALVANLGFMAVQWLRRPPPAAAAAPAAPAPVAAAPAVPDLAVAPPPDVRSLASEADAATAPLPEPEPEPARAAASAEPLSGPTPALPVVAESVAPAGPAAVPPVTATAPDAPPARAGSRIQDVPDLPTSEQLLAAGTLRVPEINLDLHVYNPDPAKRFVRINGARYAEGATLREGPRIETITADGVILDNQGTRFILRPK